MMESELLPEFTGFFANAREQRLAFPHCRGCGRFHWYPMPRCPHCRGGDIEWRPIAATGEIFSFTHVRHPFDPSRAQDLPYVVALIVFAEAPGVRLITNIVEGDGDAVRIGQPVAPVFSTGKDGRPVVNFRITKAT